MGLLVERPCTTAALKLDVDDQIEAACGRRSVPRWSSVMIVRLRSSCNLPRGMNRLAQPKMLLRVGSGSSRWTAKRPVG